MIRLPYTGLSKKNASESNNMGMVKIKTHKYAMKILMKAPNVHSVQYNDLNITNKKHILVR